MITREQIIAIRDGCEGVSKGPYKVTSCEDYWVESEAGELIAHCGDITWNDCHTKQFEWETNARHIARLDPDTVRVLCDMALNALKYESYNLEAIKEDRTSHDHPTQTRANRYTRDNGGCW